MPDRTECRECYAELAPDEILDHGDLCRECAQWWTSIDARIDDRREESRR